MSSVQSVVSVVLFNSGAKKRAYNRLNHLGISMSQKRTLRKIRAMAKKYNSVMLSWKASIESHVAIQSSIPEVRSVAGSLPVATCVLPAFDKTNSDLNSSENSLSSSSSSHSVETEEGNDEMQDLSQESFQVTGDNLDISIKTKYMSIDRRNKSLHWFNVIASNERVINADLATSRPRCSILSVPDTAFLPSVQENEKLREEFAILVERILVKYLPAFALFENYVYKHIMHKFSKEASQQSEQHCLGLLQFDENKDILQILTHISKIYVPHFIKTSEKNVFQKHLCIEYSLEVIS